MLDVLETAGEATEATTGRDQAACSGEEDGEARGPTAVTGELHSELNTITEVVNVFFLPPYGRHVVPTNWGFFLFCSTDGGYFSLP